MTKLAEKICDFLMREATKNEHGIIMTHSFDSQKKKWTEKKSEFDDIGDIVIFLAWAGHTDFAKEQIGKWLQFKNGPFFTGMLDHENPAKKEKYISIYSHQDAVLGLYVLSKILKDKSIKKLYDELMNGILEIAKKNHYLIPNEVKSSLKSRFRTTANPAVNGLIVEHLVLTGRTKEAEKIIDAWLKTSFFKKHGLFPTGVLTYIGATPYKSTPMMKENTNMLYGLIEFAKLSGKKKNIVKSIGEKLLSFQNGDGSFRSTYSHKKREGIGAPVKTQDFTLIEVMIKLYDLFKEEKYLVAAEKCARFWTSQRTKMGLIPEIIDENSALSKVAKLDQSCDLASVFLKLADKLKDESWAKEAEKDYANLENYFHAGEGWMNRLIDVNTGKVPSSENLPEWERPATRNVTKYAGGALRFILTLEEYREGKRFSKDTMLSLMSRDR